MGQLPPDLARLGDDLAAAVARGLERRRRRIARASVAGATLAAVAAVVATGALTTTSHRPIQLAAGDLATLIPRPPARRPLLSVGPVERSGVRHRTGQTVPVVVIRRDE